MVDRLIEEKIIAAGPIEAAMRKVPRERFVPDVTLERAYGTESVVTHRDGQGVAISSASGPAVVADQLVQLNVQPGHKVLEIGAGTGYNAALLAELTGPAGHVTTVDIGDDIAAEARAHLAAAGYDRVTVVAADGQYGHKDDAPYDRIIVTAGAWDIPPAWAEQLAPGGLLVLPLRIRGITRSVALENTGGCWRSRSVVQLGFMPVRGAGAMPEQNVALGAGGELTVRVDDGGSVDGQALSRAVEARQDTVAWTGVQVPITGPIEHLDFWLVSLDGNGLGRFILRDPTAVGRGLVKPLYPWGSMGVFTADTFAYLTARPGSGPGRQELGVCAYGPGRDGLAERVAERVRAWQDAQPIDLRIEVYPIDSGQGRDGWIVTEKRHTRVNVRV
jgi:protein-L-isoaspartate(D-aspartate) O-methyltransferase